MAEQGIYADAGASGTPDFVPMDTELASKPPQWRVTGGLVVAVATALDLLALVSPVFCSSNQCWAVTSYMDGGMLGMLPWLFAFPLGCFVVHALPLVEQLVSSKARKQPAPPPAAAAQPFADCLLLTLAGVCLLSTLAITIGVTAGRDQIFGGPNQLGGTGSYSVSIALFMFFAAGTLQTLGFCMVAGEIGLLPQVACERERGLVCGGRATRRQLPPQLPSPFAELTAILWFLCICFFIDMIFGGSSECAPVSLDGLTAPDGIKLEFFSPGKQCKTEGNDCYFYCSCRC